MIGDALAQLHDSLVVSVQAYPGEPMRDPLVMASVAEACVQGGAVGIRAQGLDDLREIRMRVPVPLIGLRKVGTDGVFITPTLEDAVACADAGSDIVAIDGTRRRRPDGRTLAETVAEFRLARPDVLLMADCGSLDDALAAEQAGVDCVGTTLAGYTGERARTSGPDFDLLDEFVSRIALPVIAEGRFHSPADARAGLRAGAHAVVVGTAITHPTTITGWFAAAMHETDA